jgi:GT2 family glycosyltransferase
LEKAVKHIEAEVLIMDNASKDGSIEYLQPKFPFVKFIYNKENIGFAKANNLALAMCSGKNVLFLNPDTIVPEDCLEKCIAFFESKPDAGALGIRMIDGRGKFLPESKRSFPSPLTSLFKLAGLAALFPKSKIFGRYALGYLDEHQNHEVDVLSGAFFMSGRNILNELKGFDESFFMYGEDIDLSYRIQEMGYKNYYFCGSSIIHFKGESTKKGGLNYVRMFYNAMSIFVNKHYASGKAQVFNFFIHFAIIARAAFAAVFKFIGKVGLPLLDTIIILGSFQLITSIWVHYIREGQGFINQLVNISLPGYTLVFLLAATFAGIYDNKYKPVKAFYAALVAIVVMLAAYSLLPEKFRFSRGVILFGGLTALLFITISRGILLKWNIVEDEDETSRQQKTLVVGTPEEYNKVLQLLSEAGLQERVLGRIAANGRKEDAIGTLAQLNALAKTAPIKEIIYCEGYLSYNSIITSLQTLPPGIISHFHGSKSLSIIGSNSKDSSGESVTHEGRYSLALPYQQRMKRIIDVAFALIFILTMPVQILVHGTRIIKDSFHVLFGKKTWVGYSVGDKRLPDLSKGVLSTAGQNLHQTLDINKNSLLKIDQWYAKEYHWLQDVKMIIKHYRRL